MNVTAVGVVVVLVFGENLWEIVTNGVTIFHRHMRGRSSVNMLGFCHRRLPFVVVSYGLYVAKDSDKYVIPKHYRFSCDYISCFLLV